MLINAPVLYAVTERSITKPPLTEAVLLAIEGGAGLIQLREKHMDTAALAALARELLPATRSAGVPLLIDDDVEAAYLSGADGVHVGQSDATLAAARLRLGENAIIGVSVTTVEEALAAERGGADYLGVGAVFPTATKPDAADVSIAAVSTICETVHIPVYAIGGITAENTMLLRNSGIAGIAVVSAIFGAEDICAAARRLFNAAKAL